MNMVALHPLGYTDLKPMPIGQTAESSEINIFWREK